jgi:hypothetical protein
MATGRSVSTAGSGRAQRKWEKIWSEQPNARVKMLVLQYPREVRQMVDDAGRLGSEALTMQHESSRLHNDVNPLSSHVCVSFLLVQTRGIGIENTINSASFFPCKSLRARIPLSHHHGNHHGNHHLSTSGKFCPSDRIGTFTKVPTFSQVYT